MKIACLLPSLKKQGPVIVAFDILLALRPYVERFDVFYFNESEDEIDCNRYTDILFTKLDFFEKHNFNDYDVLHTHGMLPDFYAAFFVNKTKPAVVTTVHNYVHLDLYYSYNRVVSFFLSRIWVRLWRSKDVVVFLSQHMKNYYVPKYIRPKSSKVIHNGLHALSIPLKDPDSASEELIQEVEALKSNYMLVGGCGVLNKRKGFEEIIYLLTLKESIAALIIGDGPELGALQRYAQKLGVNQRCLFLGFRDDVSRWMSLLDVYMMSSHSEGFPLVMLEAASLRIPILCVNTPLFEELFSPAEMVFYERNNETSLRDSLDKILLKKNFFSNAIYSAVSDRYSSERISGKYLNLYKELSEK